MFTAALDTTWKKSRNHENHRYKLEVTLHTVKTLMKLCRQQSLREK